jgi:hypothetical protein
MAQSNMNESPMKNKPTPVKGKTVDILTNTAPYNNNNT